MRKVSTGIGRQNQKANSLEEKVKLEEQQKALERKLKKEKEEEEQAKIIDLLEQGSALIKRNMFKEGLEKI
jgi:hypothetical protein